MSESPSRYHARHSPQSTHSLAAQSDRKASALSASASIKAATPLSSASLQHLRAASGKLGMEPGREASPKEGASVHDVCAAPPPYCPHHVTQPHRSNSLPRPRAATLVINSKKDESLDCITRRLAETYHHSLRRHKGAGCKGETSGSCCASPPGGFKADPSVAPLRPQDVCRACVTVSLQRREGATPHSIPSRSLSASTVSFLAASPGSAIIPSPPSAPLNNQFVQVLPRAQARHACTVPACAALQECGCGRGRKPPSEACDALCPSQRPPSCKISAAGRT